jgi:ribosomal protein S18 acetylase RimI-like enzyme
MKFGNQFRPPLTTLARQKLSLLIIKRVLYFKIMIRAEYKNKDLIVNILTGSFNDNKSVNYIIKQDEKRVERIKKLISYSFELCYRYGKVFISNDRKACALIILPEKKKTTLYSIYLDLSLIFCCIGFRNIKKVMNRESKIRQLQLRGNIYYLWFIGVYPDEQHKGIGTNLLNQIIKDAHMEHRTICLETSTLKNIPWYQKFGFSIYNELNLGYQLFFLKN